MQRNFERRKVELGVCGRAYGTPCQHEHACIRCPVLRPDPAQAGRLAEIVDNLTARLTEANQQGWLGEVEAESVAFVVAAAHGMPTDDYTFPYVAGWAAGGDPAKAVQATQARVGRAARLIIEASPAPHDPGGKVPGAAAVVEAARLARLDQATAADPVEAGVGV